MLFRSMHHDNQTFCILTDTGYVSQRVAKTIENADAYLMECNHDTEMLRMGPYSWPLKQRILSDEGHLSNEESAQALLDVIGTNTKQVFLGHRSQHNNIRSLAHLTVATILEQHDLGVDQDFDLKDAEPDQPSKLLALPFLPHQPDASSLPGTSSYHVEIIFQTELSGWTGSSQRSWSWTMEQRPYSQATTLPTAIKKPCFGMPESGHT